MDYNSNKNKVISEFVPTPYKEHLDTIRNIVTKIPTDHSITKEEIENLINYNGIEDFQIAFYYLFPKSFSDRNYKNLNHVVELVYRVMTALPDGAIVLAPGDSPSKIISLINLLFKVDTDSSEYSYYSDDTNNGITKGYNYYHYQYLTDEYDVMSHYEQLTEKTSLGKYIEDFRNNLPYEDKIKRIKFIQFPITGLRNENFSLPDLSRYLNEVLTDNDFSLTDNKEKLYILDYLNRGTTQEKLNKALKLLNNNISTKMINISQLKMSVYRKYRIIDDGYMMSIIDNSEYTHTRCVPQYKYYNQEIKPLNIRGCNLMVTMLYLLSLNYIKYYSPDMISILENYNLRHDKLKTPKLDYLNSNVENSNNILKNNFYIIMYYNFETDKIEQVFCYIMAIRDVIEMYIIELNVTIFKLRKEIMLGSVVEFAHIKPEDVYSNSVLGYREETLSVPKMEEIVGTLTLLNGVTIEGSLDYNRENMYSTSEFQPQNAYVNDTNGSLDGYGLILDRLVLKFVPSYYRRLNIEKGIFERIE